MTGDATRVDMGSGQRELSLSMIESGRLPRDGRMAIETLMRELSLDVVIRFLIVGLVTRPAVRWRPAELAAHVALSAIYADVSAR